MQRVSLEQSILFLQEYLFYFFLRSGIEDHTEFFKLILKWSLGATGLLDLLIFEVFYL